MEEHTLVKLRAKYINNSTGQSYHWCLSGWHSVNTLASHRCDKGSIPGVGMWDGHVVTKSDRLVSSGHVGSLQHDGHLNAYIGANEHD